MLKSYQPTSNRHHSERDATSLKKLRQEILTKEEQLDTLSNQLKKQQEECSLIKAQLVKEKEKQRLSVEETSQELVS